MCLMNAMKSNMYRIHIESDDVYHIFFLTPLASNLLRIENEGNFSWLIEFCIRGRVVPELLAMFILLIVVFSITWLWQQHNILYNILLLGIIVTQVPVTAPTV